MKSTAGGHEVLTPRAPDGSGKHLEGDAEGPGAVIGTPRPRQNSGDGGGLEKWRSTLLRLAREAKAENPKSLCGRFLRPSVVVNKARAKFTDEQFKGLHSRGLSDEKIREILGVNKTTVRQHRVRLNLPPNFARHSRFPKYIHPSRVRGLKE